MYISPTIAGRMPEMPRYLNKLYQPYPIPWFKRLPTELGETRVRVLVEEAKQLSDEEAEFEDQYTEIKTRGFMYMIPLGKTTTQHEEKASDSEGESGDDQERASVDIENDGAAPAPQEVEVEVEAEQDLDADLADMDNDNEFEDDGNEDQEMSE